MEIIHLLKGANYWEHESPREEKVKELVDRDIQKHGRSTFLTFKSPDHIELSVTESVEEYTTESTPLIWAACQGRTTLVEFFLSRGADINATDSHNRTALIWAADRGDLETALCLIKHGADLEKKGSTYTSTALNWAAYRSHPAVVKALVDAGAVIDTPNEFGNTALELTLYTHNLEIADLLLKAGAQLSQECKDHVQHWFFIEEYFSLAILLVQHGAPVDEIMFDRIRTDLSEEKEKQLRAALNHKVPYTILWNQLFTFISFD